MRVCVVSTHPDDEALGCGGALFKHTKAGDTIDWLIITSVTTQNGFSEEKVQSRQAEIKTVQERLSIRHVKQLGHPTMTLSPHSLPTLIPDIGQFFLETKPEVLYVVNRTDAHSDHRVTFQAVLACTKSFRYPFIKKVLMYECLSETEFAPALAENCFIPNYFVNISDFIEQKLQLASIYESEMGAHPFPRSLDNIKALAHLRGATAGFAYAEAFQLLKWVED